MPENLDPARIAGLKELLEVAKMWVAQANRGIEYLSSRIELYEKNPDEFLKSEKAGGTAMADDPPKEWEDRDLARYFYGKADGRWIEAMNRVQEIEWVVKRLEEILKEDAGYGMRESFPTAAEIKSHKARHLLGAWLMIFKGEEQGAIGQAGLIVLDVDDEGRIVYDNSEERGEVTDEAKEKICRLMPIDILSGLPAQWPKKG